MCGRLAVGKLQKCCGSCSLGNTLSQQSYVGRVPSIKRCAVGVLFVSRIKSAFMAPFTVVLSYVQYNVLFIKQSPQIILLYVIVTPGGS